jgi:putative DNA-invertase from lambdoid prophage Rac
MRFAYYRVSSADQSIEAQRAELGFVLGKDALEFHDENVSGVIPMLKRPGFGAMAAKARDGDTICVAAVDRLGRDAIDIQTTVRARIDSGVIVDVKGLGPIGRGAGEIVLAVLAQVADMERRRIWERSQYGIKVAKASLLATGKTHNGKAGFGRPVSADAQTVAQWRREHDASISATARQFGIGVSTVKRYCAEAADLKAA